MESSAAGSGRAQVAGRTADFWGEAGGIPDDLSRARPRVGTAKRKDRRGNFVEVFGILLRMDGWMES